MERNIVCWVAIYFFFFLNAVSSFAVLSLFLLETGAVKEAGKWILSRFFKSRFVYVSVCVRMAANNPGRFPAYMSTHLPMRMCVCQYVSARACMYPLAYIRRPFSYPTYT